MISSILKLGTRIAAPVAALAALALPGVATNAQPQAPAGQQCFYTRSINGFQAPNDHTLYIRVGVNDYWRVDLMTACTGLTWRQTLGLESAAGSPFICSPIQAQVVFRDTGVRRVCPVSGLHKLTPAEFEALPKRYRP